MSPPSAPPHGRWRGPGAPGAGPRGSGPRGPGADRYEGQVAVVSGASSGLGRALALADAGATVVGVGRHAGRLGELARALAERSPQSTVATCDLADTSGWVELLANLRNRAGMAAEGGSLLRQPGSNQNRFRAA